MSASYFFSLLLIGLFAGLLSGLLGVGGGTITIPALVFILGLSQHSAQGISLAIIIPTAFLGAYGYFVRGFVDFKKAFYLTIGSICGALLGSSIACNISSASLKKIFGVFVIIIAIRIIKDVFSKKE